MILDRLENLRRYHLPQTDKILQLISMHDCQNLPNEQIGINGEELFVKVMEYEPKPSGENRFETHQIYTDLQYVVSGTELMQVAPVDSLVALTEYDKEKDFQFFKAERAISDLVVRSGEFAIFYPGEAHRTTCQYQGNTSKIKKLVFKIKINKSA